MASLSKSPSNKMTLQNYAKPVEIQNIPTLPNRLRAFVLDRATGKPVAKVAIAAIAELEKVQNPGDKREVTIGVLASDHAGYLSFDLSSLPLLEPDPDDTNPRQEATRNVWLVPLHAPDNRFEVLLNIRDLPDPFITMPINKQDLPANLEDPKLPSIQGCAEAKDWKVSPYSFSTEDMLIVGEPGCEELLLSKAVEKTFRFSQLVRQPSEGPLEARAAALSECEMMPIEAPLQLLCCRIGAFLEYEMTWQPVGHGLGRVLYSLPLAPCESVKLAIIDWGRQDSSIRGEDTGVNENLLHNQYRDRDIDETVNASLREWQRGGSIMGGLSGVFDGVVGALGGSYSTSSGTRRAAADTTQKLTDAVLQASSLTRRLNSTVIVQASQRERERLETRTVTNHNHCHSLTVLYYEVVRHYCVMTHLAKKQDVILIKYPVISFDEDAVLRYRLVLEQVLLDQNLRSCFDIVQRLFCARLDFDPSTVMLVPDDFEMNTFKIRTTTGERSNLEPYTSFIRVSLLTKTRGDNGEEIEGAARLDGVNQEVEPSRYLPMAVGTPNRTSPLAPEEEGFYEIRLSRTVRWGNIDKIMFHVDRGYEWELAHLHVMAIHGDETWIMYNDNVGQILTNTNPVEADVIPYGGPRRPEHTLTHDDRCCVARLIKHLNDNRIYYNRAIWLAEDPDERARRFDMYQLEIGSNRGRLIDFIENRPVGVSGDYVAFLIGLDMEFASNIENASTERIISMPTRGAFAEAKLSHCNACEKRDVTRFWKWQESPCPETPPEITGITPSSRAQDIVGTPTALPAAGIGIETPPEAPAPTGMDKVLELLGKPEIFRDMSGRGELGTLLGKLVEGAVDLEKSRMENQTELQQSLIAAKTGQRTGGGTSAETATAGTGGGVETLGSFDGRLANADGGSAGAGSSTYSGTTRRTTRVNPDGSMITEHPTPLESYDEYTTLGSMGFPEEARRDLILAQYEGTPASTEEYEKLVAFHPNYLVFRARVGWTLHDVMIYRSRIYRGGARHPEIVIDRRPDLRNIHEGYTAAGTQDGDPIRLLLYLVRDEQDTVILIRIAAPDVERFPGIIVPGESPAATEAGRNAWTDIFRPYVGWIRTGPEAATGDERYGVAFPYLGRLEGYKDSIRIMLQVSISDPRIDPNTLEIRESLLPLLQWDWTGDPEDEPTNRQGARQALETWNRTLQLDERRAIRSPSRKGPLIEEMQRLFDSEYERLSAPL